MDPSDPLYELLLDAQRQALTTAYKAEVLLQRLRDGSEPPDTAARARRLTAEACRYRDEVDMVWKTMDERRKSGRPMPPPEYEPGDAPLPAPAPPTPDGIAPRIERFIRWIRKL